MPILHTLEESLGGWGRLSHDWRWYIIGLTFCIVVGLGARIPELEVDTSIERFLRDDDPVKIAYDMYRDRFGGDQTIVLAVQPPEIFDLHFLRDLEAFHRALEARVPMIRSVTSLVNVRSVLGAEHGLRVDPLLEVMPGSASDLARLRERIAATPSYHDAVISANGLAASLVLETDTYSSDVADHYDALSGFDPIVDATESRRFITGRECFEIARAIKEVIADFESPGFRIRGAGSVLIAYELTSALLRDLPRFLLVSIACVLLLLAILFRRVAPVLLTFLVVVASLISTLGIAQLVGIPINTSTQIVPSFLLCVGVCYSIHLLVVYRQRVAERPDRRRALALALEHSGVPIAATALTTIGGLLSFAFAELADVNYFGYMAALGVATSALFTLVVLPALLAVSPIPRLPVGGLETQRTQWLSGLGQLTARKPWTTLSIALVLLAVFSFGIGSLRFSSNPLEYLPELHDFRKAVDWIDEHLGGSMTIQVIVDTGRQDGLQDPELFRRLEDVEGRLLAYQTSEERLGRTFSVLDIVRETHRALNENRQEFYAIPDDRALLAQELLLFEMSGPDDLEKYVDSQYRSTRLVVRTPWRDGMEMAEIVDRTEAEFTRIMGDRAEVDITGMAAVVTRTARAAITSLSRSYVFALIVITPIMILLVGSLRWGAVSIVPNLYPVLMTLGMMGFLDIPIDSFTLLIGSIVIGLAVDDTIHFIYAFRRYVDQNGDPVRSISEAMQSTGRAMLFTSSVLSLGFLVFLASSMGNLQDFGLVASFGIAVAFVTDVTVTPALLVLVSRTRRAALPRPPEPGDRSHATHRASRTGGPNG